MDYAFSEYLPGGMKPCAFLFAEIDPSQADFNIHPAKREVRLKNPEPIKSGFYSAFRAHLRSTLGAGPTDLSAPRADHTGEFFTPGFNAARDPSAAGPSSGADSWPRAGNNAMDRAFWEKLSEARKEEGEAWAEESPGPRPPFRYLGKAFGPFLVFEKDEALYILDQHAAHERILFDELSVSGSASQALLVPFVLETGDDDFSRRLADSLPELERMGYDIETSAGAAVVNAVPAFLGEKGIQTLVDSLGSLGEETAANGPGRNIVAAMACRAAVKDGDFLDDFAARELISKALALPFPRCPHGRPIWARLDRIALDRMVGRITS
jgi:DNA mismatch repair protein MutL